MSPAFKKGEGPNHRLTEDRILCPVWNKAGIEKSKSKDYQPAFIKDQIPEATVKISPGTYDM